MAAADTQQKVMIRHGWLLLHETLDQMLEKTMLPEPYGSLYVEEICTCQINLETSLLSGRHGHSSVSDQTKARVGWTHDEPQKTRITLKQQLRIVCKETDRAWLHLLHFAGVTVQAGIKQDQCILSRGQRQDTGVEMQTVHFDCYQAIAQLWQHKTVFLLLKLKRINL